MWAEFSQQRIRSQTFLMENTSLAHTIGDAGLLGIQKQEVCKAPGSTKCTDGIQQ